MDDKNNENELIDASSSPLFQLANETKEEEQQINNDFIAKKNNETTITNSQVNQMFNKGTVASPNNTFSNENTFSNDNTFTNEEPQSTFTNEQSNNTFSNENTFSNPVEHKTFFDQNITNNIPESPVENVSAEQPQNNNESNPIVAFALLLILLLGIGGVIAYNVFFKDSGNKTQNTQSTIVEEKDKKEDTSKQEDAKKEETKQEEQKQQEITTTLICKGVNKDFGITIDTNATIVFKNNELYTITVVEKSKSLTKELIDQISKVAYVGGYSYSTTPDYKSITMSGTKNTLKKSVLNEIGTLEKAMSYYMVLGLSCSTK